VSGGSDATYRFWRTLPGPEDAAWRATEREILERTTAFNARGSGPSGVVVPGNVLRNGSFEEGPDPGPWRPLAAGSTALPGWTVSDGTVDVPGPVARSAHGKRCLDLNGQGPGSVEQTFPPSRAELIVLRSISPVTPSVRPSRKSVSRPPVARQISNSTARAEYSETWAGSAKPGNAPPPLPSPLSRSQAWIPREVVARSSTTWP
jgi:hypothetical protein